jgi:hypothetical protein
MRLSLPRLVLPMLALAAASAAAPQPETIVTLPITASRGSRRLFVTPSGREARRVLHVVLAVPGGGERGVTLQFMPAPPSLAWRKLILTSGEGPGEPKVALVPERPAPQLREPSPESELGLLRTLRLMANADLPSAEAIASANPSLELARLEQPPVSFGDYRVTNRFAVRDGTTGSLALCASVENTSSSRLLFDQAGWVLRVGDRVYPVGTLDFPGELEPGAAAAMLLVIARGPDGRTTRLMPGNPFRLSGVVLARANPRPVVRMPLGDGAVP